MKILAITYSFPPSISPRAIQLGKLMKYLSKNGCEIDVLTSYKPFDTIPIDHKLLDYISGLLVKEIKANKPTIISKVLNRIFTTGDLQWQNRVFIKASQMIKKRNYDIICSFAHPLSSHYVGMRVKRAFGLPWVIHFSDPWPDHPYMKIYGRLHFQLLSYLEYKLMEAADLIIFVSEETANVVMRKHPNYLRQKAIVIHHCYDRAEYEEPGSRINHLKPSNKIVFTYIGAFYSIRTPASLIDALSMMKSRGESSILSKILLRIVGPIQSEYKRILDENFPSIVEFTGTVSHGKALEYMLASDYLLLIDAPADEVSVFFPSKLVEYIGARRPIIGITPMEGCSSRIIRNLGYPVVSPNDTEALYRLLSDIVAGKRIFSSNMKYSQQFDCDVVSKQFISALQKTIGKIQNLEGKEDEFYH